MNPVEDLYGVREVAKRLGIDKRTVWRRVQERTLRKPVKNGKLAQWFESDIAECQQRMRDERDDEERKSK
jgi:predicted DNA-binding transcriptional regulator AlpA